MPDITIRAAQPADLPELSRLWHEKVTLQQQFDRRLPLAAEGRTAWEAAAYAWLEDTRCAIFVGGDQQGLLGYVVGAVQPAPPGMSPGFLGAVTDLALDAHRYQGGLGRALVTALRRWFEAQEVSQMVAYVPARSAVEQAFWRSLGAAEWIQVLWLK